jgi:cysteine sulfinate desulfinase/cysteine desulfurase-like protein
VPLIVGFARAVELALEEREAEAERLARCGRACSSGCAPASTASS